MLGVDVIVFAALGAHSAWVDVLVLTLVTLAGFALVEVRHRLARR